MYFDMSIWYVSTVFFVLLIWAFFVESYGIIIAIQFNFYLMKYFEGK